MGKRNLDFWIFFSYNIIPYIKPYFWCYSNIEDLEFSHFPYSVFCVPYTANRVGYTCFWQTYKEEQWAYFIHRWMVCKSISDMSRQGKQHSADTFDKLLHKVYKKIGDTKPSRVFRPGHHAGQAEAETVRRRRYCLTAPIRKVPVQERNALDVVEIPLTTAVLHCNQIA